MFARLAALYLPGEPAQHLAPHLGSIWEGASNIVAPDARRGRPRGGASGRIGAVPRDLRGGDGVRGRPAGRPAPAGARAHGAGASRAAARSVAGRPCRGCWRTGCASLRSGWVIPTSGRAEARQVPPQPVMAVSGLDPEINPVMPTDVAAASNTTFREGDHALCAYEDYYPVRRRIPRSLNRGCNSPIRNSSREGASKGSDTSII